MIGFRHSLFRLFRKLFFYIRLLLLLSLPFVLEGYAQSGTEGKLVSIENLVQVSRSNATTWVKGQPDTTLYHRDRVRTGSRSRATVQLSDLSMLRMQELTVLTLAAPSPEFRKSQLNLEIGSTYFFSREKPGELKFQTPLVSGAIRGTEFHLQVAENGQTLVTLLDGFVQLTNSHGAVDLVGGEQGIVDPGQPPRKTAVIEAVNVIQWCLYYPAIINPRELPLAAGEKETIADSLAAYQTGNLLAALEKYPTDRQPASSFERLFLAGLLLAVGQVEEASKLLENADGEDGKVIAAALREMISAVKGQGIASPETPQNSTAWLARSYLLQSLGDLAGAREAARRSTEIDAEFSFAWGRLAELEFSFGRIGPARTAIQKALAFAPENAQAIALNGFLLAAHSNSKAATVQFERALQIDPALGNAWLGRGLIRFQHGQEIQAREDLHVAATVEPRRSFLRSYLGKALAENGLREEAAKELRLAQTLDPGDPTPWLYSALLNQQRNQINRSITDLQHAQRLNTNRAVFRSKLLLEQDRAVRGANLASIYQDARLSEVSLHEASEAVHSDYANSAAHLFLAGTYDRLRDPRLRNLRYETVWLNELLLANLLAPVGAGNLSQSISQQEYSKLFEQRGFGASSSTEYYSRGRWVQNAAQFGRFGKLEYSLDAFYDTDNGQRSNEDSEILSLYGKIKLQLTPADTFFLQTERHAYEFGDVRQVYDPSNTNSFSQTFRVKELQEPNVYLGYHREWSPGSRTLFLAGRLQDELSIRDTNATARTFVTRAGGLVRVEDVRRFDWLYETELEAYSAELQHILQVRSHTFIAGARYQTGESDTTSDLRRSPTVAPPYYSDPPAGQANNTGLERTALYLYDFWQVLPQLQLAGGLSYDRLEHPRNIDIPPITEGEIENEKVSPKAGIIWTPWEFTTLRGAYTRSLGGVFYDQSVRLEPSHLAGFVQSFRSLIPESVVGLVPGMEFEIYGLAIDHRLPTQTYLGAAGEILRAEGNREVGIFNYETRPATFSSTTEELKFEEQSLTFYLNQLLGDEWSLGARHRLSRAELRDDYPAVAPRFRPDLHSDLEAVLNHTSLHLLYQHRCGFFAGAESNYYHQTNDGYSGALPGDQFWQHNLLAGYRFARRRAEIQVALLNVTDEDYKLNPLNYYLEMPRERTLALKFKFFF